MENDRDRDGMEPNLEHLQREKEAALEQLALREAEIGIITAELRHTTRLLTESRDRYADLYEFAPVGYVTLTGQGAILEANSTFVTMLDLDFRTLHNSPFNLLLASTADLHHFLTHLRRCRESGSKNSTELQLKRSDGTRLHVQLSSVPVADYASRAIVYRTAVVDVTERKEAEHARDESRRQIQSIMDATPIPIGYLDREQRFVFVNAEYLRKFRYREADVLGRLFGEVHGSDVDDLIGDRFKRGIKGEPSEIESYLTCQHSGETYFLRVNIAPDCTPGEAPCGIVIVATDLTDQKRILDELSVAKESADRANQAKSQFLANMSHELRTPMNSLLGMIQLALEGYTEPLEPKQREVLSKAHSAGTSLLRILNDILDLSRIERGTLSMERNPFSLRGCLNEAVQMFGDQAREKNVVLDLAVCDDAPDCLLGDSIRLRQVLINLIANAVKFTEKGTVQIEVKAGPRKEGETTVVFSVSDTGIGIPADKKHLLFRPFSQVDPSHTRQYGGTGVGLSISEKIVGMMGGQISFESAEGKGSRFFFEVAFPEASPDLCAPPREPKKPAPPAEGKRYRVLVAEDEPMAAEILKNVLEAQGFEMDSVNSGTEALGRWGNQPYDLIIMDVQMPGMDGLTATRAIREKERQSGRHTPILAMTAYASREEEAICLDAGMDAFIPKPLDLYRGLELITSLIEKNRERPPA